MRKHFAKRIFWTLAAGVFVLVIFCLWLVSPMPLPKTDVLSDKNFYIAHATGSIGGGIYLNCKEALMQYLDNGYRYVELDLSMTTDSHLVCVHDWAHFHAITIDDTTNNADPVSEEEFRQRKILGEYTPLTLEEAISIRNAHPYIIVTDKISDAKTLNRYFKNDRQRVMVEAFSASDYIELKQAGYTPMMSLWHFDFSSIFWNFIYYPLRSQQRFDWIVVHSSSNMRSLRIIKRLFNCKVAMFSSNSSSFFTDHLGKEVDLVYTDNWNLKTKTNNDTINMGVY